MKKKKTVFLTGATGNMGICGLQELLKEPSKLDVVILARPSVKNKALLQQYDVLENLEIVWGDLNNYDDVNTCVQGADIVLHVGAYVSPEADYHPELAMKVNYGSTMNIIKAIKENPNADNIRLVYIGTIAETGDRMPPIHWGRIGDPIKPSIHDYYAVSKVAAERAVIESGLKYWVSLRQTGIFSPYTFEITDGIIFHNCLDNVLEYVSDRDSGILLKNVCEDLPEEFWGHIYNIGGGEKNRISAYEMARSIFEIMGVTKLEYTMNANWFATRNFHGHYYLDSDKLEDYLHFRNDGFEYCLDLYKKKHTRAIKAANIITKFPGGQKVIGNSIRKMYKRIARKEHGTLNWIENNKIDYIEPFFISKEAYEAIPSSMKDFKPYTDYDKVINIDHGYDETKPESDLNINDLKKAAVFRGGECLSNDMCKGDMQLKLSFKCAFGHFFDASPGLILEGGHWCPQCERESWNYHEIAKRSEFFAQVWYPLHKKNEAVRVYPRRVNELAV